MRLEFVPTPPRVVAVLGGNAFVAPGERLTMAGQFRFAEAALEQLAPLLSPDVALLLGHGNGPQVGHMVVRVEEALGKAYALPLEVCVAESEGELGYVLQQTLHNLLRARGCPGPVVSVLTQVRVDPEDPAFARPTKPIGPFYDPAGAAELRARGFAVREEPGRGHRRVVPSPRPIEIVELDVIARLLDDGVTVIAAGGGIPVIERAGRLVGVEAVIDKDRVAALLADRLDAELLVILTGVPCAYRHFGTHAHAQKAGRPASRDARMPGNRSIVARLRDLATCGLQVETSLESGGSTFRTLRGTPAEPMTACNFRQSLTISLARVSG